MFYHILEGLKFILYVQPNGHDHGTEANAKSMLAASMDHIQVCINRFIDFCLYLDVLFLSSKYWNILRELFNIVVPADKFDRDFPDCPSCRFCYFKFDKHISLFFFFVSSFEWFCHFKSIVSIMDKRDS